VCICNGSSLVRAVTNNGIQYSRHNSLLGHNLLFCAQLYNFCAQDIISGSVKRLVNSYTSKLVKDYQLQTASFLRKIVLIRYFRIVKSCKFVSLRIRSVSSCRKHILNCNFIIFSVCYRYFFVYYFLFYTVVYIFTIL